MLKDLWRFIKDAGGWGVASNTASLIFYIAGLVAASKYSAIVTAYVLLTTSIPLFWIGSYLAWKNKDRELVEATVRYDERRPLLALHVLRQASWSPNVSMHEQIFAIQNCGGRTARFINLPAQQSHLRNLTLAFPEIPSLLPGETRVLGYGISQHGDHRGMLYEFLTENAPDTALAWWDIKASFRDTDDSERYEVIRLCFDVQQKFLYSTSVPYTKRGFTPMSAISKPMLH